MENPQSQNTRNDLSNFQLTRLYGEYVTASNAWLDLYKDREWMTVPWKRLGMMDARRSYQEASLAYLFMKSGRDLSFLTPNQE